MQPQAYQRTNDFTERTGDDTDHSAINQEFDAAATSISEIETNLALIQKDDFVVIDVRESQRFSGAIEPIDLVAGHIPGATNIPFTTNLDENGFFLSPEELKTKYLNAFDSIPEEKRVVHCGSGVTACHTLLALAIADLPLPKLYVGSWSEWSRNSREIATDI